MIAHDSWQSDIQALDFARLTDQRFEVKSERDFDAVANLMNRRFGGLPDFHRSVRLTVLEDRKLINAEAADLVVPAELDGLVEPHLRADLEHLIEFINRGEGVKTLGLLKLQVRLNPRYTSEHIAREECDKPALLRKLAGFVGNRVHIPIVLAVASRKNGSSYESLAVGLRGVTRYSSALFVTLMGGSNVYQIEGGLEARVEPRHLDHALSHLLVGSRGRLLSRGFFNRYLERYMNPERGTIVSKLCRHVFSGLKSAGEACSIPSAIISPAPLN